MILGVVVVLVLAMLVAAFVVDRRDRSNGLTIASPKQIGAAMRQSKRESRERMRAMTRRGMVSPGRKPGPERRSPGGPYLRPDEGPPRRGR